MAEPNESQPVPPAKTDSADKTPESQDSDVTSTNSTNDVKQENGADNTLTPFENAEDIIVRTERFERNFIALIDRVVCGDRAPFSKARLFPYAFDVNEEIVRIIDSRVRERFSELEILSSDIHFTGTVGFPDLSSHTYDSLDELINKAGDKKDPDRLILNWFATLVNPIAMKAEVTCSFSTEQQLETEELGLLDFHLSKMQLAVAGITNDWVDNTFATLSPFFETVKLSGIYKPLLLFRNKAIVQLVSMITAFMAQISIASILERLIRDPEREVEYESTVERILNQPTLEAKFDEYVKNLYEINPSPMGQSLLIIGMGFLVFLVVLIVGYILYPKLVPKSTISIGLAKFRIAKYQNAFRFVVFSVIICGILIPTILSLIT